MNRKQLTLLIVAGVIVVALGYLLNQNRNKSYQAGNERLGQKVIADFPINDVEQITIVQAQDQQLTIARQGNDWVVKERNGYPANFDNIRDLLRKVWDLKVAQPMKVGASQLGRLELNPPAKGANAGTVVEFKGKDGKVLHTLTLGKKQMREGQAESPFGGGGGWPNGRFVMVGTNAQTVALVTEPFANVEAKPADWIDKEFLKVEKPKSIAVSSATNTWHVARESETNEWKLVDVKAGEQLDASKASAVTSIFSYPSISDVTTNAAPEATGLDKPAVTGKIETLDGFSYEVKVGKKLDDRDDYFMQVSTTANLVKERAAGTDEKPEDKAKLDKEFKDKIDKLEEKLNKEKALAKWVYVVPKYTLEPLFKERKDLLVEKKEEPKQDGDKPEAPKPTQTSLDAPKPPPVPLPEFPKPPAKPAVKVSTNTTAKVEAQPAK